MNLDFMDEDGYFGADHVEAQKVKIPHPRSTIPLLNRIRTTSENECSVTF
jgi:hypothetical protein